MTQNEIVKTIRQLSTDLTKHGLSSLSKNGALKLLAHERGTLGGGALNQWCVQETDKRKIAALRAILKIVVRVYQEKIEETQKAGLELNNWCDEINAKPISGKPIKDNHKITPWVRKHWHKYGYSKAKAVRAYIEIHGGTFYQEYKINLTNDLKKNPLSKPSKIK